MLPDLTAMVLRLHVKRLIAIYTDQEELRLTPDNQEIHLRKLKLQRHRQASHRHRHLVDLVYAGLLLAQLPHQV